MNIVVPAEPVVAECQERNDADESKHRDRKPIEDVAHRHVS